MSGELRCSFGSMVHDIEGFAESTIKRIIVDRDLMRNSNRTQLDHMYASFIDSMYNKYRAFANREVKSTYESKQCIKLIDALKNSIGNKQALVCLMALHMRFAKPKENVYFSVWSRNSFGTHLASFRRHLNSSSNSRWVFDNLTFYIGLGLMQGVNFCFRIKRNKKQEDPLSIIENHRPSNMNFSSVVKETELLPVDGFFCFELEASQLIDQEDLFDDIFELS